MGWVFPPITPAELQDWSAFERVSGPILLHDRIETSVGIAALISAAPHTAKGKELQLTDFMPHWDVEEPRANQMQSAEEIMAAIRRMANKDVVETEEVPFYGSTGDVRPESSY